MEETTEIVRRIEMRYDPLTTHLALTEYQQQQELARCSLDEVEEIDDTEVEITQVEIPPPRPTLK